MSTTQEDTQEDGAKGDGSTLSPLKKKPRAVGASGSQGTSPAFPLRGPGNFRILDLGGTGDCGIGRIRNSKAVMKKKLS